MKIQLKYSQALEKGQVLPLENLPSITIPVSLIHKGHILQLKISRKVYQMNFGKYVFDFFFAKIVSIEPFDIS